MNAIKNIAKLSCALCGLTFSTLGDTGSTQPQRLSGEDMVVLSNLESNLAKCADQLAVNNSQIESERAKISEIFEKYVNGLESVSKNAKKAHQKAMVLVSEKNRRIDQLEGEQFLNAIMHALGGACIGFSVAALYYAQDWTWSMAVAGIGGFRACIIIKNLIADMRKPHQA